VRVWVCVCVNVLSRSIIVVIDRRYVLFWCTLTSVTCAVGRVSVSVLLPCVCVCVSACVCLSDFVPNFKSCGNADLSLFILKVHKVSLPKPTYFVSYMSHMECIQFISDLKLRLATRLRDSS